MLLVKKYILPLIIVFFVGLVYLHNLSRFTYGGDVGDLLVASAIMGVAHPPGYPLFTLLGFLFSRINYISPAFMIGLISVFSGTLGLLFFYLFSYRLTKSKLISILSLLILGFSYYFWFYNEIAEVFALNNFFAIILLFFAVSYFLSKQKKYLYLLSIFTGLSLTNHQTIILLFPSLLILSFDNLLKEKFKIKTIAICSGLFLIGLLPYLYVPIASSHNPIINWDKVHDLNSFVRLVLRKDYGTFSIGNFSPPSFAQRIITLRMYFFQLISQATLPAILIILMGMYYSYKKSKRIFVALLAGFILTGPFFIVYAGFPFLSSFSLGVYERFTILSFVILLMFLPFGFFYLKEILEKIFSKKEFALIILSVFFIIPLMLFRFNFPKTNLSDVSLGEDLVYDIMLPLPKNSVIFLNGDTAIFNAWYMHYALNFRPDVEVINSNGSIDNKFFNQIETNYLKNHQKEINDPNLTIIIIKEIAKTRNVFSMQNMQPPKGENISWMPYGLTYKLVDKNKLLTESDYITQNEKIWSGMRASLTSKSLALGNYTISAIFTNYSGSLLRTGQYFLDQYKDKDKALEFYKRSIKVNPDDPNNTLAYQALGILYVQENNCALSENYFRKSISLQPYDMLPYFFLYYDYKDCYKSEAKANALLKEYQKSLNSNLYVDLKKMIDAGKASKK